MDNLEIAAYILISGGLLFFLIKFLQEKIENIHLTIKIDKLQTEVNSKQILLNAYNDAILQTASAKVLKTKFSSKTEGLISLALNQKNSEEGRTAAIQALIRIEKERKK